MADVETALEHEIYISDILTGPAEPDWVYHPHLEGITLTRGMAPTIDRLDMEWVFGWARRESQADTDDFTDWRAPLDIANKFVRIWIPEHEVEWFGVVTAESLRRGPEETWDNGGVPDQRLSWGTQRFVVQGLEYFLARQMVYFDYVAGVPNDTRIERAIGFNTGSGLGRGLAYEVKGNMDGGGTAFAKANTSILEWSASNAVAYLLNRHGPRSASGAAAPCEFLLPSGSVPYLSWYKPVVRTEGQSVWQLLNTIIAPERGVAWKLQPYFGIFGNEFMMNLEVTSFATAPVVMPGGATLPASASTIALTDVDGWDKEPIITVDETRRWDHVLVRGARRRAVFTVSYNSGNLEAGWTSGEEAAYKTALGMAAIDNDLFRQSQRFDRVFRYFVIPAGWNGTSNDGSGVPGGGAWAAGKSPQGSTSVIAGEPICMPGLRLLRVMPIKVGWDYTIPTAPVDNDPAEVKSEWQRPFAVIDVGGGKWRFMHEMATTSQTDNADRPTSYRLGVLDGVAGIELTPSGGMPHSLALNNFAAPPDGPSEHVPEVDWHEMRVTCCGEFDAYCEGRYPNVDGITEPLSTLVISIGDRARQDSIAQGTIFDIDGTTLKTVGAAGLLRDDRNLCVQVAQIAWQWYGIQRAQVELALAGADYPVDLGVLITTIGTGAAAKTVNSLVSSITHDLGTGKTTVTAGFAELDFAKVA